MEDSLSAAASSTNPFDRAAAASLAQSVVTTEQLQEATQQDVVGMEGIAPTSLGGRLRTVAQLIAAATLWDSPGRSSLWAWAAGTPTASRPNGSPVLLAELKRSHRCVPGRHGHHGRGRLGHGVHVHRLRPHAHQQWRRHRPRLGAATLSCGGGAVNEGRYGQFPNLSTTNNPDDTGDDNGNFAGRLIPTTSVLYESPADMAAQRPNPIGVRRRLERSGTFLGVLERQAGAHSRYPVVPSGIGVGWQLGVVAAMLSPTQTRRVVRQ
ncbi:hypothetical protein GQR58_029721 [Nymphon striatum]|nr:hypothetical protein GQR58_029721 [Nymphon striatum]